MKQKEVFKKIGGIIKELGDQYEYLQTVTEDLNDLELELFVSNAHFLTDHIEILCKLNLQNRKTVRPSVEKPEITYEKKFFEPVVQQMKAGTRLKESKSVKDELKPVEPILFKPDDEQSVPQIDLESGTPADTYSFIREEPETIRHELILDEALNIDEDEYYADENETGIISEKEDSASANEPEKSYVPIGKEDLNEAHNNKKEPENAGTEDDVVTINQKISSQLKDKAALKAEPLTIKPISDIKLAITLNDKLLYVKDLFNGYNLAYSEAIEILNRFNTFEEASRFLKTNYVTKNNWESKPATTEKFYALLRRRYA